MLIEIIMISIFVIGIIAALTVFVAGVFVVVGMIRYFLEGLKW